ncbi:hypothetical protein BCAR13_440063 [Paraburkholderia caribensis]|nr:hypothetical protein BCAR13_440063 [Paraburkholderia caribensis]
MTCLSLSPWQFNRLRVSQTGDKSVFGDGDDVSIGTVERGMLQSRFDLYDSTQRQPHTCHN